MRSETVKDGYNKIAKKYNEERDQFKNNRCLEALVKQLKEGDTVLDLGCGAGVPVDRFLIDHSLNVIGLDISDAQIKLALQNVPEASYEVRDMSELQEGEFSVEGVVSFYAIFHTPREQHEMILKKLYSFLKPEGLALITMGAGEWEGAEDFHGTEMFWSHYGAEKNRELFEKVGFDVLLDEIDYSGNERHQILMGRKIDGE